MSLRIRVDYSDYEEICNALQDGIIKVKTNSFQIVTDSGHTLFSNNPELEYSLEGLLCFKSVKADARRFMKNNPDFIYNESKPNFFDGSGLIAIHAARTDVLRVLYAYEVDLVGAYWNIAKKFGFISDKTYFRFMGLKLERNASIGNLGANVNYIEKRGGKVVRRYSEKEPTNKIRLHVVNYCDYIMKTLASCFNYYDFLFYWVDGIYFSDFGNYNGFRDESFNDICVNMGNYCKRCFGMDIKVKKCVIYRGEDGSFIREYEDGKKAVFNFPKFNSRKRQTTN